MCAIKFLDCILTPINDCFLCISAEEPITQMIEQLFKPRNIKKNLKLQANFQLEGNY